MPRTKGFIVSGQGTKASRPTQVQTDEQTRVGSRWYRRESAQDLQYLRSH